MHERVRLVDGRPGLVIGIMHSPSKEEEYHILTDDYCRVDCRPDQLTVIKRTGEVFDFDKHNPGPKLLAIEIENIMKLRKGIWHDHYKRFPPKILIIDGKEYSAGNYYDSWQRGERQELPVFQNIVDHDATAEKQLSLF